MGREIRRVPLDFSWPLNEVWSGFLMPEYLSGMPCVNCDGRGWSPRAQRLYDMWYGNAPFRPEDNDSVPLSPETPAVREYAERNVGKYGSGEFAISREARRLADLFNRRWCHHLNAADVAALVEGNRLYDLTHTWTPETRWQRIEPPVIPSPEQVNEWSIRSFGHDAINAHIAVVARCKREGVPAECVICRGEGDIEVYPGQRDERETWTGTEPPEGKGWQLWETVSEGSPISPVFPTAQELARWLSTIEGARANNQRNGPMPYEAALAFVMEGWAPSFVTNAGGVHRGDEFVGSHIVISDSADS